MDNPETLATPDTQDEDKRGRGGGMGKAVGKKA
jgi:hypothetical protein